MYHLRCNREGTLVLREDELRVLIERVIERDFESRVALFIDFIERKVDSQILSREGLK